MKTECKYGVITLIAAFIIVVIIMIPAMLPEKDVYGDGECTYISTTSLSDSVIL